MAVVCVDASLVVKWLVDEEDSELALETLESWLSSGVTIVSPTLLTYEVLSVLRKLTVQGKLTPERAWEGFRYLGATGIQIESSAQLFLRAWEISMQFRMPTIYDAAYIALADIKGCPLYTCDQRLIRVVGGKLSWVKSLVDHA